MGINNTWEVIVGNVGKIYSGTNGFEAIKEYNAYVHISKSGLGRAGGEDVILFKNGEPHKEFFGTVNK